MISDDLNSVKRSEILNIGAKILKTGFSNIIDISEVASGIYILKIENDQGIFTKKIVRQ